MAEESERGPADELDEGVSLPADPEQVDRAEPVAPETGVRTRTPVLPMLALIVALAAFGAASYPLYLDYVSVDTGDENRSREVDRLKEMLTTQSAELGQLRSRLEQMDRVGDSQQLLAESVKAAEALVDPLVRRLSEQATMTRSEIEALRQEFHSQRATTTEDWLLAEVEYLIRMANQQILMAEDPAAAVSLLESADEILSTAEALTAHRLRAALAEDLARLRVVSTFDLEGTYLRLGAQIGNVPLLQRPMPEFAADSLGEAAERSPGDGASETPSGFLDAGMALLTRFGSTLENLVDFRRSDEAIEPILPPSEEYYLRQNLVLKMQQAQLGLLDGRQEVFSTAIDDSIAWLDLYFDPEHPASVGMREVLVAQQQLNVARELPDISGSLRQVRKLMKSFDTGNTPAGVPKEPSANGVVEQ